MADQGGGTPRPPSGAQTQTCTTPPAAWGCRAKSFARIWRPQALHRALPTTRSEMVLQMKSTPLVATIPVVDIYSLSKRVTQDTFIVYEPLLLLAVVYMIRAGLIVLLFRWLESRVPSRTA